MIRYATPADIMDVAQRMREADKEEIEVIAGLDPLAALSLGHIHSDRCIACVAPGGEVVGIAGVSPIVPEQVGSIWFLSTDGITKHARRLVIEGRKWLDALHALYPVLTNVVTESNDVHIRLIKHLGFNFMEPIDNFGVSNVRVLPFESKV